MAKEVAEEEVREEAEEEPKEKAKETEELKWRIKTKGGPKLNIKAAHFYWPLKRNPYRWLGKQIATNSDSEADIDEYHAALQVAAYAEERDGVCGWNHGHESEDDDEHGNEGMKARGSI